MTTESKRSPWPTIWVALPLAEARKAKSTAGTNGLAIYTALHIWRFNVPGANKGCFHASASNLSDICGISERRLREPLRRLEEAGLIKISRPVGEARMAHEAFRYSLVPLFLPANKVEFGADKTSGPNRTKRPVASGHEVGAKSSDSSIVLSYGERTIEPAAASEGSMRPPGAAGKTSDQDNTW